MFKVSSYTGGIAETNGWVLETDAGTLAVDAPEGFADWLEEEGVKVDALLLTHQHFDHVMNAAEIKARQGCPVAAFARYSKNLTLELLFGAVTGTSVSVKPFDVDHVLEGRGELAIAGVDFKLLHVPGHSPDSVCFHAPGLELLFGGDVLFAGSIGRTDFPGGSMEQLLRGIEEKVLVLDDSTRVFPGHGPETTIGDERNGNPYLQ